MNLFYTSKKIIASKKFHYVKSEFYVNPNYYNYKISLKN